MSKERIDEVKFKALGQNIKPMIGELVNTIKQMRVEHIVLTISADGDSIIQGSLYKGELDPVIVREKNGRMVLRTVKEEEIKQNGEESLPDWRV